MRRWNIVLVSFDAKVGAVFEQVTEGPALRKYFIVAE
jgi:hypothetical protein